MGPFVLWDVFVVDAPSLFHVFWAVIKPITAKHTAEKVTLLDSSEYLKKFANARKFPKMVGGKWDIHCMVMN